MKEREREKMGGEEISKYQCEGEISTGCPLYLLQLGIEPATPGMCPGPGIRKYLCHIADKVLLSRIEF